MIISWEGKREREKESKEQEMKNNSTNTRNRNKGTGKETTYVDDEQSTPKKKGCKNIAFDLQEGQYQNSSGSTSQTNLSSPSVMLEKHMLEFVLDVLQRNDPENFFVKPVNPNVEDRYWVIRQPTDFGTVRAKIHDNMYSSMEHFKFDVYQLCSNVMKANPSNTRPHQVAVTIHNLARKILEDLSVADLHRYYLESLPTKTLPPTPSRKPHGGHHKTIGHARFRRKPSGDKNIGTSSMTPEMEKRAKHILSDNRSLCTQVFNAPKPSIQLGAPVPEFVNKQHVASSSNPSRISNSASQAISFLGPANTNNNYNLYGLNSERPTSNYFNTTQAFSGVSIWPSQQAISFVGAANPYKYDWFGLNNERPTIQASSGSSRSIWPSQATNFVQPSKHFNRIHDSTVPLLSAPAPQLLATSSNDIRRNMNQPEVAGRAQAKGKKKGGEPKWLW